MRRLSRFTLSDEHEGDAISEKKLRDGPVVSRPPAFGADTGNRLPNLTPTRNDGIPMALRLKGIATYFVPVSLSHDLPRRLFRVMYKKKAV